MHPVLLRNNVKILGEGSQVIVFAHGFGCAQSSWKFITDAFLKDYKVILFDYVGSGDSDLSQYEQRKYATLEGYACDVIEIIEALNLKNIIFVGHSVSSMIGMIAALQMPKAFKKLVFIGPSPRYLNDGDYIGGFNVEDTETIFEHIAYDYVAWSKQLAPVRWTALPDPNYLIFYRSVLKLQTLVWPWHLQWLPLKQITETN